ncbi:MAG: hypothetical protein IT200_17235 [Thermoleophilia bacterium]|nr:hypothetical protein [Thermoleophilia bacterium]
MVPLMFLSLLVAAMAGAVLLRRRRPVVVEAGRYPAVLAAARSTRAWRARGLAAGVAVAAGLLVAGTGIEPLGRLTALAPAALGAGVLVGAIVGERAVRAAGGAVRTASLEARSVTDLLPRGLTVVLGAGTVLLVAALATATAWGSADDMGRAGRRLVRACTVDLAGAGEVAVTTGHGPWPGSFYAVPLAVAMLAIGGLGAVALRVIVRRPRPAPDGTGFDTTLRRWSVADVVGALTVAALGTLGPVSALMAMALTSGPCDGGTVQRVAGWLTAVVAVAATGGALALLGGLLAVRDVRPGPGAPAPPASGPMVGAGGHP